MATCSAFELEPDKLGQAYCRPMMAVVRMRRLLSPRLHEHNASGGFVQPCCRADCHLFARSLSRLRARGSNGRERHREAHGNEHEPTSTSQRARALRQGGQAEQASETRCAEVRRRRSSNSSNSNHAISERRHRRLTAVAAQPQRQQHHPQQHHPQQHQQQQH